MPFFVNGKHSVCFRMTYYKQSFLKWLEYVLCPLFNLKNPKYLAHLPGSAFLLTLFFSPLWLSPPLPSSQVLIIPLSCCHMRPNCEGAGEQRILVSSVIKEVVGLQKYHRSTLKVCEPWWQVKVSWITGPEGYFVWVACLLFLAVLITLIAL